MKYISIFEKTIFFVFLLTCISEVSSQQENDVRVDISRCDEDSSLNICIELLSNNNDTLVTFVEPFLLAGFNDSLLGYPESNGNENFISPSTVYCTTSKIKFLGDGYYKIVFKKVPKILVLPPSKPIKIILNLYPAYSYYTKNIDWDLSGFVTFGLKKNLDSLINISDKWIKNKYQFAVINDSVININPVTLDSIRKSLYLGNTNNRYYSKRLKLSRIFWRVFKYISWSKKR